MGEKRFTRGRLSRGKGLRNTTGCSTCRRRRVKCDERKPSCGNCVKSKRSCLYATQHGDAEETGTSESIQPEESTTAQRASRSREGLTAGHVLSPDQDAYQDMGDYSKSAARNADTPFHNGVASQSFVGDLSTWTSPGYLQSPRLDDLSNSISVDTHRDMAPMISTPELQPSLSETAAVRTAVSTGSNVETATARWLGLLIGDVAVDGLLPEIALDSAGIDIFGNSTIPPASTDVGQPWSHHGSSTMPNPALIERFIKLGGHEMLEKQAWHSEKMIELLSHEKLLFQSFVRHISCWMDFFDPKKSFGTFVPRLAMHNAGLMNAILCLSARYSFLPTTTSRNIQHSALKQVDAIQYYYKTLHYIQEAMQFDTYKTSLELLSTTLVISTYEMLDGASENWERHLQGVFWIQRSQTIHGDSKGLRAAVWWAWLCQDVWAAFREKRRPFTFWRPVKQLNELDPHELASRSVYFFAQAVGFCSKTQRDEDGDDLAVRIRQAENILQMLEEWRQHLTVEFEPLPSPDQESDAIFPAVWIHPSPFGVAMQLYYCSMILVAMERPLLGGMSEYLEHRKMLSKYIKMVCGIAKTQDDYESSVLSSQCLFIAGLSIESQSERDQVLEMLSERQQRCGWPTKSLGEELQEKWKTMDQART